MIQLGTRTLETDRLTLRRYTVADAEAMYANWASDDVVTEYLTWPTHPDSEVTRVVLETWVEQYEEDGFYNWGIVYDGTVIGNIAVVNASENDERAEIGYCIGRAWWGKGIMTEALGAVMDFLFGEVGLHRIFLRYDVANIGSGRVMEKNGLTREGTLRDEHKRKDGSFGDMAVYGILRHEWEARKA